MSKIAFSKLNLKKKEEVKTIKIGDIEVEVKQYLPVNEKLELITNVLTNAVTTQNSFANPVQVDVFTNLEIVYAYTNLTFTDKQKETPDKLYDLLEENGIFNEIIATIPENEYNALVDWVEEIIENYYKQLNSAYGIMERIVTDYKDTSFDAAKIKADISDPNNLELLKNVMEKLG